MSGNANGQVEGDPPFGLADPDPNKYGDDIKPSNPNNFRHYHCNINGILQQNDFIDAQNHSSAIRTIDCESASIVEHNCNMNQTEIRTNLHDILRQNDRRAAIIISHIKSESHRFDGYQPGGTLLQINSSMSSRVIYRHQDDYARWSHAILSAKKGTRVHIISAYRVCQSSEHNVGPNTAYMQQYRAMAERGVRNPRPRQRFFHDLEAHLTKHIKPNDKLILSMDANEPDHLGSALSLWKERNGLTNALHHLHGENSTKTFQRGRFAIDHTFVNDNCLPALRNGGHLPFNMFHISDHCGHYLDFHKPTLFGKNTPDPTDGTTKYPRPYHPTEREMYHGILSEYFKRHNIKEQLLKIIDTLEQHEPGKAPVDILKKLNAIERKRTELMLSAAKQCHNIKKGGKYPYSPKLVAAAQPVLYWKERLSCHRNEVPMPPEKEIVRMMYNIEDNAGDHRLLIE